MFTLYTTTLSANGRKAWAGCLQLGLDPQIELVDVYRGHGQAPAYLAKNPLGKVPSLVDGDFTLSESNAILQYASEAYADCRLWSREPKRRAEISRWLFWEAAHWQPCLNEAMRGPVAARLGVLAPGMDSEPHYAAPELQRQACFLDTQLSERDYLTGAQLTLADLSVAAMLTYATVASFPLGAFPNIAAWYACIEALPAWQATRDALWSA